MNAFGSFGNALSFHQKGSPTKLGSKAGDSSGSPEKSPAFGGLFKFPGANITVGHGKVSR